MNKILLSLILTCSIYAEEKSQNMLIREYCLEKMEALHDKYGEKDMPAGCADVGAFYAYLDVFVFISNVFDD